jgi:hypothetical protein
MRSCTLVSEDVEKRPCSRFSAGVRPSGLRLSSLRLLSSHLRFPTVQGASRNFVGILRCCQAVVFPEGKTLGPAPGFFRTASLYRVTKPFTSLNLEC